MTEFMINFTEEFAETMNYSKVKNEIIYFADNAPENYSMLFNKNLPVDVNSIDLASITSCLESGILYKDGFNIFSKYYIFRFDGDIFLCDWKGNNTNEVFRPYIEEVSLCSKFYLPNSNNLNLLELGCGCGIYGIRAAHKKFAKVDSYDINPRAIKLATINSRINSKNSNIKHNIGNLYDSVNNKYDLIISGLPYVPVMDSKQAKIYCNGGLDGLKIFRKSMIGSVEHLVIGGEYRAYLMSLGDENHALIEKELPMLFSNGIWNLELTYIYPKPFSFYDWYCYKNPTLSDEEKLWFETLKMQLKNFMHYCLIKAKLVDDNSKSFKNTIDIKMLESGYEYNIPYSNGSKQNNLQ